MKCTDTDILLQLAADAEITDTERVALEHHLSGCVACRRKEAWFEVLEMYFPKTAAGNTNEKSMLEDAVVAALDTVRQPAARSSVFSDPVPRAAKKQRKARKKSVFSRIVTAIWKRRNRKRAKNKSTKPVEKPGWIDASVNALLPAPTSLDGFRAAKQGVDTVVSGPVRAVKWVAGILPRKGRSQTR